MDTVKVNAQDRATIEDEIKKLENPTLCPPDISQVQRSAPNVADVQAAVEQLRDNGKNLPNAQSVQPWNGKTGYGTFVDLGDGLVAQHNGRGNYSFMDVQQDLGGVQPPIGQYATLFPNGQSQVPQIEPFSLARG